ncbi:MAG: NAD(P)/FAD-dependent oxidoreductase [Vulcanococcus sp.]
MASELEQWSLVVAGGGPAGFMAAIAAAEQGLRRVLVLESTPEPLGKVLISGGGRCNVTHACWDPRDLVGAYPRGGQALRGPFSRFAAGDAVAWFDAHGLELVEEADGRLFPRSNRSSSVIACLRGAAECAGVELRTHNALAAASPLPDGGFALQLRGGEPLRCDRLVLATGSHPSGRRLAEGLLLRLPLFGDLIQKTATAQFCRTFSSLTRAGVPILLSLEIVQDTAGNAVIADAIVQSRQEVLEGIPLSTALASKRVFPELAVSTLAIGEETGQMDAMLSKVADFYEDEVEAAVKALTAMLEPAMIVIVGGIVGSILLAMYLPMFSIFDQIK